MEMLTGCWSKEKYGDVRGRGYTQSHDNSCNAMVGLLCNLDVLYELHQYCCNDPE